MPSSAVAKQDSPDQSHRLDRAQHPQKLEHAEQLRRLEAAGWNAGQQIDPAPAHELPLALGLLQTHPEIEKEKEANDVVQIAKQCRNVVGKIEQQIGHQRTDHIDRQHQNQNLEGRDEAMFHD